MKKSIILLFLLLIVAIGVVSVTKYFDMSLCCYNQCFLTSNQTPNQCSSQAAMFFNHINKIKNTHSSIIGTPLKNGMILLALLLFLRKKYSFALNYSSPHLKYLTIKFIQRYLGRHMNPFYFLRFLFARGIIGSQKHFA